MSLLATLAAATALQSTPFPAINHVPLPPSKTNFTFVALGDNRPAGSGQGPTKVFRQILSEVGTIHPDFVISSGDLVYGNEESVEMYRTECDQMAKLLSTLKVPFFNAPGNHEIADKPDFAKEYQARLGALYGAFEYGGYRFVGVCTEEIGSAGAISDSQMSWIKSQLDGSKPAFVFFHHPIYSRAGNAEEGSTVKGGADLAKVFASSKVQAVFQGHDHVFNHQTHDGVEYFISGGAGAPLDALPQDGGFFHYIVVQVQDGKATYSVCPMGSIDVVTVGNTTRVSNYSDVDLELGDVQVACSTSPSTAKAMMDKKGKMTEAAVKILSVEKAGSGFVAHLALSLGKHRQTIVTLQ